MLWKTIASTASPSILATLENRVHSLIILFFICGLVCAYCKMYLNFANISAIRLHTCIRGGLLIGFFQRARKFSVFRVPKWAMIESNSQPLCWSNGLKYWNKSKCGSSWGVLLHFIMCYRDLIKSPMVGQDFLIKCHIIWSAMAPLHSHSNIYLVAKYWMQFWDKNREHTSMMIASLL